MLVTVHLSLRCQTVPGPAAVTVLAGPSSTRPMQAENVLNAEPDDRGWDHGLACGLAEDCGRPGRHSP